ETVNEAVASVARYDPYVAAEALLAHHPARYVRVIEGLRAEGEQPTFVLFVLSSVLFVLHGLARGERADPLFVQHRLFNTPLPRADAQAKNRALGAMAKDIRSSAKEILAANSADVAQANGADAAFIDRLTLTPKLIEQMAEGVEQVAQLADPVGQISERVKRPTGIEVARMRVPIGVIGIIYESRPNVTADAAA